MGVLHSFENKLNHNYVFFKKPSLVTKRNLSESVCVFVLWYDNSKRKGSKRMKFEYVEVYIDGSDKFNIGYRWIKVKVTVGLQIFFPYSTIKTVTTYTLAVVQARKLIFSMHVHLVKVYTIYEYCYA